jgi:predicted RNA methylase
MKNLIPNNKKFRNKNDYYPTAPIATLALLKSVDVPKCILEPCAGRGWISKVLEDNGHNVISKDLYEYENPLVDVKFGHDFLMSKKDSNVEGIITNPPFGNNLPLKMLKIALRDYDFVAFFCRLFFLETVPRGKFFTENPMHKCIVMSNRIQCNEQYFDKKETQLGGMVQYAWFVWDKRRISKNELMFVNVKEFMDENSLESFFE